MRSTLALISIALLLAPATARAQDDEQLPAWRDKVNQLVDRWADDVGSGRLLRASTILVERLKLQPDDGEALLALARIKLALPPLSLRDPYRSAKLMVENYQSARERADQAAKTLSLQQTDPDGKKHLIEKGGARHHAALAVGYLASQLLFRAEVNRRRLIPNPPGEKAFVGKFAKELARRHKLLDDACGSKAAADQLIQAELHHREMLEHIDRLGVFPRPLALDDLQKKPIDLTAYRGKVVLIVFWASKLEGTIAVLDKIEKARKAFGKKGLVVIGVNLDDRREQMDAFLAAHPLPGWRHAFASAPDPEHPNKPAPRGLASRVARAWGLRALPDGVLVDHTGRVRYLRPWEKDLRLEVQELLNRAKRRSS